MKLVRLAVTMVLLTAILTGCWGVKEIEHMVYANSIGVDYVDGKIVIYMQMINLGGVAKKESGSREQKIFIGKATGNSVDEAIFNLYASSQQRIAWSHVKAIVFSQAALQKKLIEEVLDVWDRYYEFRYTVWTMATVEPIEEVLTTPSNVDLSVLYSRLNNPNNPYEQNSVIAPMYLNEFIWNWEEKGDTTLLPYLQIDRSNWTEQHKPTPKLQMGGVCFLQNKQLKGCLARANVLGLRWLDRGTIRSSLSVKNGQSQVAMFVMEQIKPAVKVEVKDGKAYFHISVAMVGHLPELDVPLTQKKLETLAAEEVRKQIRATYEKALEKGADVYKLSDKLFRENAKAWHSLQKNGRIPLDSDSIASLDVKVNLKSGGISKLKKRY